MSIAPSLDEFPIKVFPSTPQWSENYALMFGDPQSRTAVYYSIGRNLADLTIWRELISVVLPNGRIIFAKNYGRGADENGPGGALTKLDVLEIGRRLRLSFSGPVTVSNDAELNERGYREGPKQHATIDLHFAGRTPVWNMKGDSREAGTIAGSMHMEQMGFVDGSIDIDGQSFRLSRAYGVRDHSRGIRDVSQYRMHAWINGVFDDGRAFALYLMQMQDSPAIGMSNAVVFHHDQQYPATVESTDLLDDTDDPAKRHRVVLGSALGRMEIRVTEIVTSFPNSMVVPYDMCPGRLHHQRSAYMLDQLVHLDCEGQHGIGWTERGLARQSLL